MKSGGAMGVLQDSFERVFFYWTEWPKYKALCLSVCLSVYFFTPSASPAYLLPVTATDRRRQRKQHHLRSEALRCYLGVP